MSNRPWWGLAVLPHQPGPVYGQEHLGVLQGYIVDELVVSPLQEGGVHGEHRQHPPLPPSRRQR